MCGIVGMMGNLNDKEGKAFRDMLILDVVRGQDSTGVMCVPYNNGALKVFKEVGHPLNLWAKSEGTIFDRRGAVTTPSKILLGHNRAATVGSVTKDNAHPFTFGHVTGVHNGSLWDTDDLEGKHDVDSKQVFDTISKKGIEHTWANIYGAAALVWYDASNDYLHMIRNKERPLYYAYNKLENVLMWASEEWMIVVAARSNGVSLNKVESLELNTLKTFDTDGLKINEYVDEKLEPAKVITRPMAGFRSGYINNSYYARKTSGKEDSNKPIHTNFAKGLPKGGAELRNIEFTLNFCVDTTPGLTGNTRYGVGAVIGDKTRVEVFPQSIAKFNSLFNLVNCTPWNKRPVFRLTARPRLSTYADKECYVISGDYIRHVGWRIAEGPVNYNVVKHVERKSEPPMEETNVYSIYGNKLVNEQEFLLALGDAGQSCCYCGEVLNIEDHKEVRWLGVDSVLCPHCANYDQFNYGAM